MSGRIGSIGGAAPRVPPHPGGHLGLTWRAPTDDDVAGVVALLVQDARRRRPLRPPSLPELRHTLGTDAGPGRGDALVGVDVDALPGRRGRDGDRARVDPAVEARLGEHGADGVPGGGGPHEDAPGAVCAASHAPPSKARRIATR